MKPEEVKKKIINDLKKQKEPTNTNKYYLEESEWIAWNKAIDIAIEIVEDKFYYLNNIKFKKGKK